MDVETFMKSMPGLSRSLATSYLNPMEQAMREFNITNTRRCWMWLAQVGHESVSLRYMEEIASGVEYNGRVDLGNTHPGDGPRYKGRGPIQITGRANYTSAGNALHLNLVGNPQLAAQPSVAFRVSAWWWATHGLNQISDTGDVVTATRRINGGLNGLADREQRYSIVKRLGSTAVLPTAPPKPKPKPQVKPMQHDFRTVQGCPCGKNLAPYIAIIVNDAHATVNSIYRGTDAEHILNAHGKHSQAQLYQMFLHHQGNPANPPGFSTHEQKSDGVAYPHVPRGRDLAWWQVGFDVNDNDVNNCIRVAGQHGWHLWRPYPTGSEYHHLNFAQEPKPGNLADRITRLRDTLPRH